MSDTLNILKNKANLLTSRLKSNRVIIEKKYKFDLLAYICGEGDWKSLVYNYHRNPGPYTRYQPSAQALHRILRLNIKEAQCILNEISWPTEYPPIFNTLPLTDEGEVAAPKIIAYSELFNGKRKRREHLQQRIALRLGNGEVNKDVILYSGETLKPYDENVFYSVLNFHPSDKPVGSFFKLGLDDLEAFWEKSFSIKSLQASLTRMTLCRVWIPLIDFCGPIISEFRFSKTRRIFSISLNPELTKLYYDPLYSHFMDSANLFHHKPKIHEGAERGHYDYLHPCDRKKTKKAWTASESDVAAIFAIHGKSSQHGQCSFKFLETVEFIDEDRILIKLPEWVIQATVYFNDLYGNQKGPIIFNDAMSCFFDVINKSEK